MSKNGKNSENSKKNSEKLLGDGRLLPSLFFVPNFAVKNYKMEKIVVNPKDKKLLIEKYGYKNVSVALSFKSNSVMAKEIRHEAMNVYKGTIFKF